jgi:hypothetical protein
MMTHADTPILRHAFGGTPGTSALCGETAGILHITAVGVDCPGCLAILAGCRCWSCDRQCGGDPRPGWCGPVADVDGRPICEACRKKADVFDTERHGAAVSSTLDQDQVQLRADVFDPRAPTLWLDPASARHLAALLIHHADQLDGDGLSPELVGRAVYHADDDAPVPEVGTIVDVVNGRCLVRWVAADVVTGEPFDELRPAREQP